jgi:hypothetical protein
VEQRIDGRIVPQPIKRTAFTARAFMAKSRLRGGSERIAVAPIQADLN